MNACGERKKTRPFNIKVLPDATPFPNILLGENSHSSGFRIQKLQQISFYFLSISCSSQSSCQSDFILNQLHFRHLPSAHLLWAVIPRPQWKEEGGGEKKHHVRVHKYSIWKLFLGGPGKPQFLISGVGFFSPFLFKLFKTYYETEMLCFVYLIRVQNTTYI